MVRQDMLDSKSGSHASEVGYHQVRVLNSYTPRSFPTKACIEFRCRIEGPVFLSDGSVSKPRVVGLRGAAKLPAARLIQLLQRYS